MGDQRESLNSSACHRFRRLFEGKGANVLCPTTLAHRELGWQGEAAHHMRIAQYNAKALRIVGLRHLRYLI